jgi:hypothetical protein
MTKDASSGDFDLPRIERAVREILVAIGEDPERDGLRDTPARVARAYAEQFAGLRQRPADVLTTVFDAGHDEMVIVNSSRSSASRTSATSRTSKARSLDSPNWPGWSMSTPGVRRSRNG